MLSEVRELGSAVRPPKVALFLLGCVISMRDEDFEPTWHRFHLILPQETIQGDHYVD